jgi:hypothetical protein
LIGGPESVPGGAIESFETFEIARLLLKYAKSQKVKNFVNFERVVYLEAQQLIWKRNS